MGHTPKTPIATLRVWFGLRRVVFAASISDKRERERMLEIPTIIGLGLGFDGSTNWVNKYVVDPYLLGVPSEDFNPKTHSVHRKFLVIWAFLLVMTYAFYFTFCPLTYYFLFKRKDSKSGNNKANWYQREGKDQVRNEIKTSLWSIAVMTAMTAPFELLVESGKTKIYWDLNQHGGKLYAFVISPILFITFSDTCIYWIHRALHHKMLYKPLHKLHHRYKETTPFSAYAFHPIDGWLQGCPYHIFVFLFPMHHVSYFISLACVGMWTINIHDRVTWNLPFVNGAAHHTVHHTGFNYNYGQYLVFWDKFGGSYKDPFVTAPYNGTPLDKEKRFKTS